MVVRGICIGDPDTCDRHTRPKSVSVTHIVTPIFAYRHSMHFAEKSAHVATMCNPLGMHAGGVIPSSGESNTLAYQQPSLLEVVHVISLLEHIQLDSDDKEKGYDVP